MTRVYGSELIDADEKPEWAVDWNAFAGSETVSSSSWSITPVGPTLSGSALAGKTASVQATGFERGKVYELSNIVTLSNGVIAERAIVIRARAS